MARRADQMAERAWSQMQEQVARLTDPATVKMFGEPKLPPIMQATRDEIIEHWRACEDAEHAAAAEGYTISLDPAKLWGEDVQAVAAAKIAKQKRRAGYKALKNKYGEESAKRIISREGK